MALIQINDFIEDDARHHNSVQLMASWQAWLSSHDPFVRLNSGDNSLRIAPGAFFSLMNPFRWYRVVETQEIITQAVLDVGGNYKSNATYYLFLVDDGSHGRFSISESAEFPLGTDANHALCLAQFRTEANGVIVGNSIYDSQMRKMYEALYPIGHFVQQLPGERSPQDRFPFLDWIEISSSYEGDFFRVTGGLAGEFEAGVQAMSAPNITGTFGWVHGGEWGQAALGAFFDNRNMPAKNAADRNYSSHTPTGFDASRSDAAYGRREEVAPQNQSMRLWRRVGVITGMQQVAKLGVEGELLAELELAIDSAGIIGFNPNCMTLELLPKESRSRSLDHQVLVFNRGTSQWQSLVDHRGKVAYSAKGQRTIFSIGDQLQAGESWDAPALTEEQAPIAPLDPQA